MQEGTLRLLTSGELRLARELFHDAINYAKVWIHCDSYLPFGLQQPQRVMAPNGEIYFRSYNYCADFSLADIVRQHLFMHEMTHVWQFQKSYNVRLHGLFFL
ncbi:hypothetical protein [Nissabacter sp. SGAir0207]|uniref:hypothetical protein n=1 Tax=Nissabacter sp. SGAir0207 TaxID=2126321 RepID=UPI0010CD34D3|nr:hypothetical protein [Nissabacter sp. SGAir0207]QCR36117.1 hypothetical protein C1N62_08445 [Nissabacter sp. SGAir0207]